MQQICNLESEKENETERVNNKCRLHHLLKMLVLPIAIGKVFTQIQNLQSILGRLHDFSMGELDTVNF